MKNVTINAVKISITVLITATALLGCKKDNVNKPATNPQISFGVKADNSLNATTVTNSNQSTSGVTVNWTEGIANIVRFKFEAKKAGSKKEIETNGLTNIDLFSNNELFANTNIDTGSYSEIEIKALLAKSATAVPLTLKGSFTKGDGSTIIIQFILNEDLEIKAEAKNVIVDKATDLKTTVKLHLNRLFQTINVTELESATVTSGTIIISSTSNSGLYNKVKSNIGRFGEAEMEGGHHNGSGDDNNHQDDH